MLTTVALAGTVAASALVFRPGFLIAAVGGDDSTATPTPARDPANQQVAELLGSLIAGSYQVVGILPRGETPYDEVVLWLEDGGELERIDAAEVAVLSHSRAMQTVCLYTLGPEAVAGDAGKEILARSDMATAGFAEWWRTRADARRRVLATKVTSMRVTRIASDDAPGGAGMLSIELTWAHDPADVADEATVLLHAALSRLDPTRME